MDGSGNPWFAADVALRDGRIAAIGDLEGATTDAVLDVSGKVVAPGFIDIHSHAGEGRRSLTSEDPVDRTAPNLTAQGATTLVVNQDGRSPWPISDQRAAMETQGIGPNAVLLVGHGRVRSEVMGDDFRREATPDEVEEMGTLVRQAMSEGAYGLSAGHEYSPMIWSTTDEVVALVDQVAPWSGIYVVHERSSGPEPMWWWPSQDDPGAPSMEDAVRETIEVAERTGVNSVQTHIKARGSHYWGTGAVLVEMIQKARDRGVPIWADAYSYNTTGTDGNTVLIPRFVRDIARREANEADVEDADYTAVLTRLLSDPDTSDMIRMDVAHEIRRRGGTENLLVLENRDPALVGKTLRDLSIEWGLDPVQSALKLQMDGEPARAGGGRLRGFSLSEQDLALFYAQPWVATASDAGITKDGDGSTHPRLLRHLPQAHPAVYPRSGDWDGGERGPQHDLPSRADSRDPGPRHGPGRGCGRTWSVFDLEEIRDMATALEPHQFAEGVEWVFVNGAAVVEGGRTHRHAGGKGAGSEISTRVSRGIAPTLGRLRNQSASIDCKGHRLRSTRSGVDPPPKPHRCPRPSGTPHLMMC